MSKRKVAIVTTGLYVKECKTVQVQRNRDADRRLLPNQSRWALLQPGKDSHGWPPPTI